MPVPRVGGIAADRGTGGSGVKNPPCTARARGGARYCNLAISEAAYPLGRYYATDPSSQIACTIGGNVAENSGGVHCLKYGLTLHNVLKVRGFTMAGALHYGQLRRCPQSGRCGGHRG